MAEDQINRRWKVRQVARGLRYQAIDELIGQTVTIQSAATMLPDVQTLVDELGAGFVFQGPEERNRAGTLAKCGLLDLTYTVPAETTVAAPEHGLTLLKELGFLDKPDDGELGLDMFDCVEMLLDDLDKNEPVLLLFLEERPNRSAPASELWQQWMNEPERMPFPKTMEVVDACLTNSPGIWLNKHFYL